MDKKENLKDRLMDELLREDARGDTVDEQLLDAVEAAIDGDVEDGKVTPMAERHSRVPYAWAALLTVSAASVLGYFGWKSSQRGDEDLASVAMEPGIGIEAPRNPVPRKMQIGRYQDLWSGDRASPFTEDPDADAPASQAPPMDPMAEGGRERGSSVPSEARVDVIGSVSPSPVPVPEPGRPVPDPAPMDTTSIIREDLEKAPARPMTPRPKPVPAVRPSFTIPGERDGVALKEQAGRAKRVRDRATDSGADAFGVGWGSGPDNLRSGGLGAKHPDVEQRLHNPPPVDRENYGQLVSQPWKTPLKARFSTFSVDVDTASYTNIRRMLRQGARIPADAVRIEECINYFDYRYAPPTKGGPFAVHVDMATCPWASDHHLMKVGIKGMEVNGDERPASNLVFLIDVSGSMQGTAKLPLLVDSMKVLVEELDDRDRVGIVVYAGSEGVVLDPTSITEDGRGAVLAALNKLRAGGSTNGGAGIKRAYAMAKEQFVTGGVNRVILATDGDFNVGTTSQGELVKMVKEQARSGVYLSVLGFGSGNINDAMLEAITNDGNGNYFYIDSQKEGRKVFLQDLSGTLVTIAKDVKIQVDFNPGKVQAYRLIGYANRILRDEDFNNDKIDAGDIGAGHTVTALYEIVPHGAPRPAVGGVDASKYDQPAVVPKLVPSDEWLTVKLRYKRPDGDTSTLMEVPVAGEPMAWQAASDDFRFASSVALFGMKLRDSEYANDAGWGLVGELAKKGLGVDVHGYRAEFLTLVDKAAGMAPVRHDPQPGIEAPVPR
jgi:Ca-activated chloride channel family protein